MIATYDAGQRVWVTEKLDPQNQVIGRFTSSDNPLDPSDPGRDGVGLWGGGRDGFTTADFDSIDATTGLPGYTRTTTYSDNNSDGFLERIQTSYHVGGLIDTQTDSNGDGLLDGRTLSTANGQGWNLFDFNSRLDAEQQVVELRDQGLVGGSWYESLTNWITKQLVSGGGTNPFLNDFDLSQAPIGAFYESKTPAADTAASIAHKTSVFLDANGRGLTAAALGTLDGNRDGRLSGTEILAVGKSIPDDDPMPGIGNIDTRRGLHIPCRRAHGRTRPRRNENNRKTGIREGGLSSKLSVPHGFRAATSARPGAAISGRAPAPGRWERVNLT